MSFSRSLSGSAVAAIAALAALPAEQKTVDQSYNASPGVVEGHQRQIAAIASQVKPVLEAAPEAASISGSVWGHANADQSGTFGFSLSISGGGATDAVPAAVPAAGTTTPAQSPA